MNHWWTMDPPWLRREAWVEVDRSFLGYLHLQEVVRGPSLTQSWWVAQGKVLKMRKVNQGVFLLVKPGREFWQDAWRRAVNKWIMRADGPVPSGACLMVHHPPFIMPSNSYQIVTMVWSWPWALCITLVMKCGPCRQPQCQHPGWLFQDMFEYVQHDTYLDLSNNPLKCTTHQTPIYFTCLSTLDLSNSPLDQPQMI